MTKQNQNNALYLKSVYGTGDGGCPDPFPAPYSQAGHLTSRR